MRDILLTLLIAGLLPLTFKHPVVGAYLWAWVSLMNPHKLTYGFAFSLPFAQVIALVTLFMVVATKKRQALPMSAIVVIQILLLTWMSITSLSAMASQETVFNRWLPVMKIHIMLFVTWMLVVDSKQLRTLIWIVTLSVCFFGIKGGIWTVATGGGGRVWGPPGGMLQDNNQLAVGLVMLMPMLYFLRYTEPRTLVRHALAVSMVAVSFSILGSQSRGALLALLAMAFFLGLKGKHPVRTSLMLLFFVALAVGFMPDSWTDRMDTMRNYEADTSALSRIWTWKTLWAAALDNPMTGVGFGGDTRVVFERYAPRDPEYAIFSGLVFVAHSIYLQMLGEHGFVGLGLFLLLGAATWITAGRLARKTRDDPELGPWMPLLMRMVQVSLIGFAVGGAFLSLAYLDLPYYVIGFVVSAGAIANRRSRPTATTAAGVATRGFPSWAQATSKRRTG